MKRLLVIGTTGDYGDLDICVRAQEMGWDVRWFFLPTDRTKDIGKGLVQRVDDWRKWVRWATLVLSTDNTKYTIELERFRKEGVMIVGATPETAAWEMNRTLGQKIFKRAGIDTLPYKEFSDYDQAIAYVKRENRRFVSKPCGDEPDKSLSYVAKSGPDMVFQLMKWKKQQKLKSSFIIQDFTPGVEMAVGGWFGPGGFNEGWLENWEEKALMAGGMGPSVGESGTTMRYVKKSKLADKVLKPCEDAIEAAGYIGYIDVNCIIDDEGKPWPLEWTCRPGWPTLNIQQELHEGDFIEWLADLCEGRDSRRLLLDKVALGVVLAIPEYPYNKTPIEKMVGVPVYGLSPSLMSHVHPCQMMWGPAPQEINGKIVEAPMMLTAGDYVLVASGAGDTVREARTKAYRTLEHLKAPSSPFWRPDIGMRLKKQLPEIQAKGYATGMEF